MILCVVIPDFVISLEQSTQAAKKPLVVFDNTQKPKVYAASNQAKQVGVIHGMSQSQARSACRDALEIQSRPLHYQRTANSLCEELLIYTDRLEYEQTASLTVWLDCGKVSPQEMHLIATSIREKFQSKHLASVFMGLASGRWIARIAALTDRSGCMQTIPIGCEQRFLAPIRLLHFDVPKKIATQWGQLGIDTLADLGRLPYNAVRTRYGDTGTRLHHLANGQDQQIIPRYIVPLHETQERHFDDPIKDGTIIDAVLKQIGASLTHSLTKQGLATRQVSLNITCDDHMIIEVAETLRRIIQTEQALIFELQELFAQVKVTSGVTSLRVTLDNLIASQPQQLDFFGTLFKEENNAVTEIVRDLSPRHTEIRFTKITVRPERSYIPEQNIRYESVAVA